MHDRCRTTLETTKEFTSKNYSTINNGWTTSEQCARYKYFFLQILILFVEQLIEKIQLEEKDDASVDESKSTGSADPKSTQSEGSQDTHDEEDESTKKMNQAMDDALEYLSKNEKQQATNSSPAPRRVQDRVEQQRYMEGLLAKYVEAHKSKYTLTESERDYLTSVLNEKETSTLSILGRAVNTAVQTVMGTSNEGGLSTMVKNMLPWSSNLGRLGGITKALGYGEDQFISEHKRMQEYQHAALQNATFKANDKGQYQLQAIGNGAPAMGTGLIDSAFALVK